MKTLHYSILFLAFLSFFSSEKEDQLVLQTGDHLIFGSFAGECIGDQCVELFKLSDTGLFETDDDRFPLLPPFGGVFTAMSSDLFEDTKVLLEAFPTELLEREEESFGCPDCVDHGGIYLKYKDEEVYHVWILDTDIEALPAFLQDYTTLVAGKIRMLRE